MGMNNRKKGFTLTEILVVIVIIGIILAIAIPGIVSVRNRIYKRLLEDKRDIILVAAKLYAKDKELDEDTTITVFDLIEYKYVETDVEPNEKNCTGDNTAYGCVINPVTDTHLNNDKILIVKNGKSYEATWEEEN